MQAAAGSLMSSALTTERVERGCRLIRWTPWPFPNNSLIGHATVSFAGGWQVHKIPVFKKADGSLSVGTPSAAELDSEGRVRLRENKKVYSAVITFETNDARNRWQHLILAALAAAGVGQGDAA
jgi:hypothetical protein